MFPSLWQWKLPANCNMRSVLSGVCTGSGMHERVLTMAIFRCFTTMWFKKDENVHETMSLWQIGNAHLKALQTSDFKLSVGQILPP